ncbi:hypothetical protein K1T71_012504 [Dendrolimus kikuchii]|uniref:Uncharacterized protein n=1 Tax=Dendrolimus kikuchii TaxID=765133 RepID=A0ACC1CJX5_9NEOP|nr:hypothetical protein K1T71_012504 [Dendrolimus kikuchii]
MRSVILIICFISTCYCKLKFNDRPRNFSIELLYHTQSETEGQMVISPFGIWCLMTNVALGAQGNSFKQVKKALRLPKKLTDFKKNYKNLVDAVQDSAMNGVTLVNKNFMFFNNDFIVDTTYKNIVQDDLETTIQELDFNDPNSVRIANKIIQSTVPEVSDVLNSDDLSDSRMILTNVVTFKGIWNVPFNVSETIEEPFYSENKQIAGYVKMMYQSGEFPFSNVAGLKAFALELPYGTAGKYSMLLLLPHPNTKIKDMYRKLAEVTLKDIFDKLQSDVDKFGSIEIDVRLPRFKISTDVVMNKPLNDMGVLDIFQPDLANFKKITREKIFVSSIIHKAEIEVTEAGTVATASSTAKFSARSYSPLFYANRPFAYFIMEKSTLTVIFSGIYSKPTIF